LAYSEGTISFFVVQRQHHPDRRRQNLDAWRLQFRHRRFPGLGFGGIETLLLVAILDVYGLRSKRRFGFDPEQDVVEIKTLASTSSGGMPAALQACSICAAYFFWV
jgi:hypothetical protein